MTWKNLEAIWIKFDVSRCLPRLWGLQQGLGARVVLSKALYVLAAAYNDPTNARCGRSVRTALAPPWSRRMLYCRSGIMIEECCTVGAELWYHRVILIQSSLHFFQKIEKMQIMQSRIMSYFPESPTSSSNVQEILDLIGQDGWSLIEESSGIQRDTNLQNFRHWFD